MPTFSARVVDGTGRVRRLAVEAVSASQASAHLVRDGALPVTVEEAGRAGHGCSRIRRGSEIAVARQIASLLEAGITLDDALSITLGASSDPTMRLALETVWTSVRSGDSLASAFAGAIRVFPPIGIGMIAAGERSGALASAFVRLADYLETRDEQRQQLLAALSYPTFLLLAGLAATAVLIAFVLPRFSEMLVAAAVPLPATTTALLGLGELATRWWLPAVVASLMTVIAGSAALRRQHVRRALHGLLLRTPAVGTVRRSSAAVHVGHALSSLLAEGVPVVRALGSTAEAMSDLAVKDHLLGAARHVRSGASLSDALRLTGAFPAAFVEMIRVGERGARVPDLMHRAALIEEDRLNRLVQRLIRYAEPAMIIGFGGFIGFVALALLQAVYGIHGGITP